MPNMPVKQLSSVLRRLENPARMQRKKSDSSIGAAAFSSLLSSRRTTLSTFGCGWKHCRGASATFSTVQ